MPFIWNWYTVICIIVVVILKFRWDRRKLYTLANSMSGPPALPIIGNALSFLCKEEDLFQNLLNLTNGYSSPIRLWLGPKLIIILTSAEEMEEILTSPKCNDKDDIYRFLKVFDGSSLFTSDGATWKKQRKLLSPFFGHKYMESYFNRVKANAAVLVEKLKTQINGESFHIEHHLHRCYNDIVTEVLMGFQSEAQNGKIDDFLAMTQRMYVLVHSRMMKIWLYPDCLFQLSRNGKEQIRGRDQLHGYIQKGLHLAETKKKKYDIESDFVSVLEQLMACKSKYPDYYADQNVIDHLSTLYTASEDTVTSICSYLLVLLGMYPDVQKKVVQEIGRVLGTDHGQLDFHHLSELKYLDMCVKEIIRLFPIGPCILRKLNDDFRLGSRIIPKDCTIMLNLYSVQRDPKYWEKPTEFYPEHFLPDSVSKRHPYAFLPFSAGPRSCPGQLFAYVAVKTVTATVLQHYILESDGTLQSMKLKADISIRPVERHKLKIKPRNVQRL